MQGDRRNTGISYSVTPVTAARWARLADFFGPSGAYALLAGAVLYAAENRAAVVEGYPVDTTLRRPGASGLFTGTLRLFTAVGFTIARARSPERPVVQRIVGPCKAG